MKNLDGIINQLANEQQRTEHLLMQDLESVKKACTLFFDKQAREADSFMALLHTSLEDILSRVKNGYPADQRIDEPMEPIPAIVSGRKLTEKEREKILSSVSESAEAA